MTEEFKTLNNFKIHYTSKLLLSDVKPIKVNKTKYTKYKKLNIDIKKRKYQGEFNIGNIYKINVSNVLDLKKMSEKIVDKEKENKGGDGHNACANTNTNSNVNTINININDNANTNNCIIEGKRITNRTNHMKKGFNFCDGVIPLKAELLNKNYEVIIKEHQATIKLHQKDNNIILNNNISTTISSNNSHLEAFVVINVSSIIKLKEMHCLNKELIKEKKLKIINKDDYNGNTKTNDDFLYLQDNFKFGIISSFKYGENPCFSTLDSDTLLIHQNKTIEYKYRIAHEDRIEVPLNYFYKLLKVYEILSRAFIKNSNGHKKLNSIKLSNVISTEDYNNLKDKGLLNININDNNEDCHDDVFDQNKFEDKKYFFTVVKYDSCLKRFIIDDNIIDSLLSINNESLFNFDNHHILKDSDKYKSNDCLKDICESYFLNKETDRLTRELKDTSINFDNQERVSTDININKLLKESTNAIYSFPKYCIDNLQQSELNFLALKEENSSSIEITETARNIKYYVNIDREQQYSLFKQKMLLEERIHSFISSYNLCIMKVNPLLYNQSMKAIIENKYNSTLVLDSRDNNKITSDNIKYNSLIRFNYYGKLRLKSSEVEEFIKSNYSYYNKLKEYLNDNLFYDSKNLSIYDISDIVFPNDTSSDCLIKSKLIRIYIFKHLNII